MQLNKMLEKKTTFILEFILLSNVLNNYGNLLVDLIRCLFFNIKKNK